MLEPDTQIVPPRGSNHAVEAIERAPTVPPDSVHDRAHDRRDRHDRRDVEVRDDPVALRRWVGRYELIQRLAHGGMATVYLGRAKGKAGFEKVVAVKVIHPHLAGEAEFVRMFLDEARIAARIHHPHVVEILDLGESDGAYFMVMEFIEGENLAGLTRAVDGPLPVALTLQIVADTLEGLTAAHELRDPDGHPYKLVHRDISPHNILINLDGWTKVGDFGIMKASGKASNTKTGELRGKLAYMSPEQARGVGVDHRTDLFAVGVIIWELLTGKRLFARASEAATLEQVIHGEVPRLDQSGFELDDEHRELLDGLQQLLDQALAGDPDKRPNDAASMLTEVKRLIRLVEGLPHGADPRVELGALMHRFFRRRVEYARAALRRTGEHDVIDAATREMLVEPTVQVTRPPTDPAVGVGPLGVIERTPTGDIPQTGSNPALGASATSLVAPSPLVQWSLWLLLPMLGAGIAIAAMLLFGLDRRSDDPKPTPTPASAPAPDRPAPASLAATEFQPVAQRPTPTGQVRWYFSTSPRGAQVVIDGETQGGLTPTWVYLPIGEDPRDIRIELEGYEPLSLQLPAVHDQTFSETLEPLAHEPAGVVKDGKPSKRVRKPSETKPGSGLGETKPDKPGTKATGFLPVPDSLRDGAGK